MERLRQVAAVTQPVAVSADVHDVAAVEQPIPKRRRHHLVPEDRSPLFESLVGSRHRGRQACTRSASRKRLSSSRRAVSASCRFRRWGPTWGDSEATMASAGLPVVSPSRMRSPLTACGEHPRERRDRRGARLTGRVREEPPPGEARVYFDRNATMSGAQRRGSAGMDRRSNAVWVLPQAVNPEHIREHAADPDAAGVEDLVDPVPRAGTVPGELSAQAA